MFKVDRSQRVPLPPHLFGESADIAYFNCVELSCGSPIWLIEANQRIDDDFERRRRFQVATLEEAVDIMTTPHWQSLRLYVLLPPSLTGSEEPTLSRCLEIWECQEPEDDQLCWRMETTSGNFLHSLLGTPVGQEIKRRAWFRSVDFELAEPTAESRQPDVPGM